MAKTSDRDDMAAIELRRIVNGLTQSQLAGRAEISVRTYQNALTAVKAPRKATIAKLKRALALREVDRPPVQLASDVAYRTIMIALAQHAGLDAGMVLGQDAGLKATADADWMAASRIREQALHILNGGAGMHTNELARAAGLTPAAVSLAICRCEDRRDNDPALDQLLDRMNGILRGVTDRETLL